MGGKTRVAAQIGAIMRAGRNGRDTYVEPFVGGGSVAAEMAPEFGTAHLSDANEDLAMLWEAVRTGWVPPVRLSEELWRELKYATEPSALRAFAGFGASFGGKWFTSYAQDDPRKSYFHAQASAKSLMRDAPKIRHAQIRHLDYADAGQFVGPDAVVYCDPPYENTTGYGAVGRFDSDKFWDTARAWSDTGAQVYVSEYAAPEDWVPVWKLRASVTVNRDDKNKTALEQLFIYGPTLETLRKERSR
jgi:DNA adenine methylase